MRYLIRARAGMLRAVFHAMLLVVAALPAAARNVPGSAAAGSSNLIEPAANDVIEGLLGGLSGGGADGYAISVATKGTTAVRVQSALDQGLFFLGDVSLRSFDLPGEVENGRILTGSLGLGFELGPDMTAIVALLGEGISADTPFNFGTIRNRGFGAAAGLRYAVSPETSVTALVGMMRLNYDITRAGGAVTGDYAADRLFFDLRGQSQFELGRHDAVLSYGARYIGQWDDPYVETGGGPVAAARYQRLVGFINGRVLFDTPSVLRPYVDADLRLVGYDDLLPFGVLASPSLPAVHFGAGIGMMAQLDTGQFEFGVRANGSSEGFTGYQAHLGLSLRF